MSGRVPREGKREGAVSYGRAGRQADGRSFREKEDDAAMRHVAGEAAFSSRSRHLRCERERERERVMARARDAHA